MGRLLGRSLLVADGREGGGRLQGTSKVTYRSPTVSWLSDCRKGIPLCHGVLARPEDKGRLDVGI